MGKTMKQQIVDRCVEKVSEAFEDPDLIVIEDIIRDLYDAELDVTMELAIAAGIKIYTNVSGGK